MCTSHRNGEFSSGRPFGDNGCEVPVGKGICGEKNTLNISEEFKKVYQDKLNQIDIEGGGDSLQAKLELQQDWISDLTQQNDMLIKAVEELEYEATERVQMLETKLQQSAQCICEVMKRYREHDVTQDLLAEPLQKVFKLENDQRNLLEFIRRVRQDNNWCLGGLTFYDITPKDIYGGEELITKNNRNKFDDTDQEEQKLFDKENLIRDLQSKLEYYESFGNIQCMSQELKCKNEECEALKQSMVDMRQALTEEVAAKHDLVIELKKDVQQLEERCLQADKQIAFKDDIIKELRKEIKQLKQQEKREDVSRLNETILELKSKLSEHQDQTNEMLQLKDTIHSLERKLTETMVVQNEEQMVCKICKGRSKVAFSDITEVSSEGVDEGCNSEQHLLMIRNKEEIIKIQNDTLNNIQIELQALRTKENEARLEKDKKQKEIEQLYEKIAELEGCLNDAQQQIMNLQSAVDLYMNSISVLEASQEKSKIEVEQQKVTICNLQDALVTAKHEMNELKNKSEDNCQEQENIINIMYITLLESENEIQELKYRIDNLSCSFKNLQDINYDLEMDHFNTLQDVDDLENQIHKYQIFLKSAENETSNVKENLTMLSKQKQCYEDMVQYFKEEMRILAEQLFNLQGLLTRSNETAQEEHTKLTTAFFELQSYNERLTFQLAEVEKKAKLETDMNKVHSAKIAELEQVINDKDADLCSHDQAIFQIRDDLISSQKENENLQSTINDLNNTIAYLQNSIQSYENDNKQTKESTQFCRVQVDSCKNKLFCLKQNLEKKTKELYILEEAYRKQQKMLDDLKESKEKRDCYQKDIRETIEELKFKLKHAEVSYSNLCEEFTKLQNELAKVSRREQVKDIEIKRYRKIVKDLKNSLIDLNKSLTNKDFPTKCKKEECRKMLDKINQQTETDDEQLDHCKDCPCEVEFYQGIVETLKKSVVDLKNKLTETQFKFQSLSEDAKKKEAQLEELTKSQAKKQKECASLKQKLMNKLHEAEMEESRYVELANQFEKELSHIKQELQEKTVQLDYAKRSAQEVDSTRCIQLASAQEEVSILKTELNRLLQKHVGLNEENQKLHCQTARLQSTVSSLEERSHILKGQMDQYLLEVQHLQTDKESLARKNQELLSELRSIQISYGALNKQQRYALDSVRNLEIELLDVKNNRDDICNESKNVVSYVKAWLQEQKRLNEQVAKRERDCNDYIEKLKSGKEDQPSVYCQQKPRNKTAKVFMRATSPPHTITRCQSPWSLGSQGAASYNESSRNSPCNCDWYSSTFKNEESDDYDEEDWINKVESLAAQVRKTNKMWKSNMNESPPIREARK